MPLVTGKEILDKASKNGYAVGAFNVNNLEIVQGVMAAADEMRSPVILQATENAAKYAGFDYLAGIVQLAAKKSQGLVALHLDHGESFEVAKRCVDEGFTSVMIDGSHLAFKDNIAVVKKVVEYAHSKGVSVEAELGRLGGIEDNIKVDAKDAFLTDPEEAQEFVISTGVDYLAVAVGTSHGAYKFKGETTLALERIKQIKSRTGIPLVLHGASSVSQDILDKVTKFGGKLSGAKGVPDDSIKEAIKLGINKINIDTDIRLAFTAAVREALYTDPKVFDPRKILGPARDAIKEVVKNKILLFGSAGKS